MDYVTIADWDNRAVKVEADINWTKDEVVYSIDRIEDINRRLDEMETKLNCKILLRRGLMEDKPEQYSIRITQGVYMDGFGEVYLALDDKEESWVEKELKKNIFLN